MRRGNATVETVLLIPVTVLSILGILGLLQLAGWQQATQAAATGAARAAAVWLVEDPTRAEEEAEALARGWVALALGAEAACTDQPAEACAREAWDARKAAARVDVELHTTAEAVTVLVRFRPPTRALAYFAGLGDRPVEAVAASHLPWRESP